MSTVDELLEKIEVGKRTVFDLTKGADGAQKVIVEQRQLLAEEPRAPKKAESKRRAHTFHDLPGFKAYLKKYGGKDTVLFADVNKSSVSAVLDEQSLDGKELVSFEPQLHPRWAPWEALLGQELEVNDFIDFVRMHRRTIVKPDGRELALALSQIKASTEITLHKGKGKKSLNGLLVKTEIQGVRDEQTVELPEELLLDTPIFVASGSKKVLVDLIIETEAEGQGLVAKLSSGDLLEFKVRAFEEMLEQLAELSSDKDKPMTVTFGRAGEAPWDYLR